MKKPYFGWYVVAGGFVSQLLVVGFFTYAVSLLVNPVRAEFGVSLEQVMYAMTIGTLAGLVLTPVCGALLDRYPARWLMSLGIVLFAGGLWWAGHSASITEYVIAFGLTLAITNGLAGPMAASTTVSRWFTRSRGKALGVSAIGTSAGGVLIPALVTWWLAEGDWRGALHNLALLALLVILPVTMLSVRGRPEDVGLRIEDPGDTEMGQPNYRVLNFSDITGSPAFWYIGLTFGLLFCVYSAVISNLTPYARELGFTTAEGSRLIMILAVASFVGKIVFGLLADRLDLKMALWLAIGLIVCTLVILTLLPAYPLLVLASVLMGLATGGMLPVWGAMMARTFGLASYGMAMGLMGPVITLAVMPGYLLMGRLYDSSGSYQLGMTIFAGLAVASALLLLPLKLASGNDKSTP
jgi:predicted MFS family arabinose efflux permease